MERARPGELESTMISPLIIVDRLIPLFFRPGVVVVVSSSVDSLALHGTEGLMSERGSILLPLRRVPLTRDCADGGRETETGRGAASE